MYRKVVNSRHFGHAAAGWTEGGMMDWSSTAIQPK
jgi:hypothetical protein